MLTKLGFHSVRTTPTDLCSSCAGSLSADEGDAMTGQWRAPFTATLMKGKREEVDKNCDALWGLSLRVHKCMAVAVQVKFIIFPICLMLTYAHHASAWQLIWQKNQAQNVMTCRLTTPSINIYREARRPRRVIITLRRPECSILQSEILLFIFFG